MSEMRPDDLEQQLRRYYQRQHRAESTPGDAWRQVAARLAAPAERSSAMNDTPSEVTYHHEPLSEKQRMQRNANPPRRGFVASAAGLVAVVVLALLAHAVFTRGPAGSSSYINAQTIVNSSLNGISMVSADDGWAVGSATREKVVSQYPEKTPPTIPLLFHYTGGAWQLTKVPAGLNGSQLFTVAMRGAQDGWAGGGYNEDPTNDGGYSDPPTNKTGVLLHYDGSAWVSVTVPDLLNMTVQQIVYDPSGDAWAIATSSNYTGNVEILHEQGGAWSVVDARVLGGYIGFGGISMVSASEGWAAITHYPNVQSGPATTTLLHLQNGTWRVTNAYSSIAFTSLTMLSVTDGWATASSTVPTDKTATPTAVLFHYTDGVWKQSSHPLTSGDQYYGPLFFADATHGWMHFSRQSGTSDSGFVNGLYAFDGSSWKDAHVPVKVLGSAASFSSPTDGWFVGEANYGDALSSGAIGIGYFFTHYHDGVWTTSQPVKQIPGI